MHLLGWKTPEEEILQWVLRVHSCTFQPTVVNIKLIHITLRMQVD